MKKVIQFALLVGVFYSILPTFLLRRSSESVIRTTNAQGILLTFDDGPNAIYTPQLLDILAQHDVKATFFVVAKKAQQHPAIIERIVREGHTIGIHHYTHKHSYFLTPYFLYRELKQSQQILQHLTKQPIALYRPTYGHMTMATWPIAQKLGLRIVLWSDDFKDWRTKHSQSSEQLQAMLNANKDGAIYLLHDDGQNFGANDGAPYFMLYQLQQFLKTIDTSTLAKPTAIFNTFK